MVKDASGEPRLVVQGTWDQAVDMVKVTRVTGGSREKVKFETDDVPQRIWTVNPPMWVLDALVRAQNTSIWREFSPGAERMHNFTRLAIELNEPEPGVAPTDSRLRPDQRLMEEGQ